MTFDDDTIFLETAAGRRSILCGANGIEWPPPKNLVIGGMAWKQISCSVITDEQRAELDFVLRGALYHVDEEATKKLSQTHKCDHDCTHH